MKEIAYIYQNLAEFVPQFINDRKKDIADIRGLIETGDFEGTIEILKTIRETANTFGFKELTAMSSHAVTVARRKKGGQANELIEKMAKHLEKIKVVYVDYGEEDEMDFYERGKDIL